MFRTELTIAPQERQFSRSARVLTIGSCFADSIGERLRLNKVTTLVNPFGTVFQPLALAKLLRAAAGETQDWQQHVVEARGRWQSYDFHSTVGADSPVELLQSIQQTVQKAGDFLRGADLVVLTLGTAWAYRLRETDELIGNLHKLPAGLFTKELLTADEIVNGLAEVHALLRRIKPDVRIVLTVSPVRHLKDTLPLNAVSKSVLRVACHYLSELLPGVSYFPAYELLNDDLRDYRYYGADMLHLSEVAEEYVWDKFARAYFDADFGRFRKEWAAVRQSLTHRPLHLGAPEHRTFLDQTAERLERLIGQGVEVRQELRDVQRQLAALPPPRPIRVPEVLIEDDGEERIDIGGEASENPLATSSTAPEAAPSQREGRGRNRRGRGRDQGDRRNEPQRQPANTPTPAETQAVDDDAEQPEEVFIAAELPVEALPEGAATIQETVTGTLEEVGSYPAKKKKRRSRGGAKRTARKHAARLAAEQTEASTNNYEAEEAGLALEIPDLDEQEATPLADSVSDDQAAAATEAPLVSEPVTAATTAAEAEELTTLPDAHTVAAPAMRKRGTGPTPKKSKVITKSSQVKRPKRTNLFRTETSARPAAPADAQPAPAEAPIISTPILSETLLERPLVAELVETTAALATNEVELSTAPKPRRGRPRAQATLAAADEPTTEAATDAPTAEATPTPAKPRRTAKPKAASTEGPAPTRRGRPPGKKIPPAAETSGS